jgi:hypothetical protein
MEREGEGSRVHGLCAFLWLVVRPDSLMQSCKAAVRVPGGRFIVALWQLYDVIRPWNNPHRDIQRKARDWLLIMWLERGGFAQGAMLCFRHSRLRNFQIAADFTSGEVVDFAMPRNA